MIAAALSLTVIYIPQYFRVVRNTTISAKEATYVEAARALGASDGVIMRRYLFGNVDPERPGHRRRSTPPTRSSPWPDSASSGSASSPTEAAEWGFDLSRALDDAGSGIWWTALYPGLAIVLLVTGLTLVGEGLNETVNPILRRRRLLPVVMPRPRGSAADEEVS